MSKFSVGEICEVTNDAGRPWQDCEIIAIGNPQGIECSPTCNGDYTINVPSCRNPWRDSTVWLIEERNLRKKRPPADYIPLSVRDIFKIGETA